MPNVTPEGTAATYEKVLLSIQEVFSDVISRDDPEYWFPNGKARKLIEEEMAREKKRAQKGSELLEDCASGLVDPSRKIVDIPSESCCR